MSPMTSTSVLSLSLVKIRNDFIHLPTLRNRLPSALKLLPLPPLSSAAGLSSSAVRPLPPFRKGVSKLINIESNRDNMGSRLGRRVVHFANLPIKLLMPSTFTNIKEIALKTIPSASKIEIKRVLESLYGFEVEKVSTLNMEGKKKKRGGLLIAKPDYKKAYVTLKNPLSISPDLFPIRIIEEDKRQTSKQSKSSVVEEGEAKKHWLHGKEAQRSMPRKGSHDRSDNGAKFPWSSMRSAR